MRLLNLLLIAFVCAGCVGGSGGYSPNYSYAASTSAAPKNTDPSTVTIKQSAYATSIEVESDVGERAGDGTTIYLLAGSIDKKTGAVRTFVQWGEIYTARDWRFYSRASTNKSEPLEFNEVSRKVSSCSRGSCVYNEMYNVYFTPAQMRQAGSAGLDFKVFGRRGDERVVTIPAAVVADFNAKMVEAAKLRGR